MSEAAPAVRPTRRCEMLREITCSYRIKRDARGLPVPLGPPIRTPATALPLLFKLLADEPVEVFGVICLNTKGRALCWHEVSRGSLDRTSVHLREVFKAAIIANASALIAAHSHPSGDPAPSPDDAALTRRLMHASRLLGVPVLDHIIIGHDSFVSLRAASIRRMRE